MSAFLTHPTNKTSKRLFIAATRMNDGKTTSCLGLFAALQQKYGSVGFIKPVGQRFVTIDGQLIDEDSVLLESIYHVQAPISSMSPIAIDGSFTRRYLEKPQATQQILVDKLCRAFDRASWEKDFTLIEGSGHAGVGSVFDLSNARVAKTLQAKAIIISQGGIGRPVDEIALNKALFDKEGVEVAGAIINKVQEDKLEDIREYVKRGLQKLGIPLLGMLPTREVLTLPNLGQVAESLKAEWPNKDLKAASRRVQRVIIGAMSAPKVIESIADDTLLITPGDREDLLEALLTADSNIVQRSVAGIALTRGIKPSQALLGKVAKSGLPILLTAKDSYSAASKIHGMTVKTQPSDQDKIPVIKKLIQDNVDLDLLAKSL